MMLKAALSISLTSYAQVRDSNSNKGYTVLNGLGCSEARIAAGEWEGGVEAFAAPIMVKKMMAIKGMISENLKFGLLIGFFLWCGSCFVTLSCGVEIVTVDVGVVVLIFVGGLLTVGLWLSFGLVFIRPTWESVFLTGLVLGTGFM